MDRRAARAGGASGWPLGAARLVWAAVLLAAPGGLIRLAGAAPTPPALAVARVLGARHAVQGLAEVWAWPRWGRAGVLVDSAHGLTAAGLAALDRPWRRVAAADMTMAAGFAWAGWSAWKRLG
jgi:hypothetical protein